MGQKIFNRLQDMKFFRTFLMIITSTVTTTYNDITD